MNKLANISKMERRKPKEKDQYSIEAVKIVNISNSLIIKLIIDQTVY